MALDVLTVAQSSVYIPDYHENTSGFLPDMNAQIGALNYLFPLVIALNSWTGGKLSKVNYQRSFIQISPYNINLVLSYLMSPCLVPRLLHCHNFRLTDNTFYSRRLIHVVHVGFSCLPFHNSPACSPTDQCWPIGRDISTPLFSGKKLQKMSLPPSATLKI